MNNALFARLFCVCYLICQKVRLIYHPNTKTLLHLKLTHLLHDAEGYKSELYYIRDKDKRETDFLVTVGGKPWFSVEVKSKFKGISTQHKYFREKLSIPYNYIVTLEQDRLIDQDGFVITGAARFLSGLV